MLFLVGAAPGVKLGGVGVPSTEGSLNAEAPSFIPSVGVDVPTGADATADVDMGMPTVPGASGDVDVQGGAPTITAPDVDVTGECFCYTEGCDAFV